MPIQGTGWYRIKGDDSIPIGLWKKYSLNTDSNGKYSRVLIEKAHFEVDSSGMCHSVGKHVEYFGNGNPLLKYRIKNRTEIGKEIWYYKEGGRRSVVMYDGIHFGPYGQAKFFYQNGKLKEKGRYGEPARVVTIDSVNKILVPFDTVQNYDASKVGLWEEFYPSGKLKACGNYLPFISYIIIPQNVILSTQLTETTPLIQFVYPKDGIWKYYDENNRFFKWEKYENGFLKNSGVNECDIK